MKVLIWLLFQLCLSITEITCVKYSYTIKDHKLCMTDCVPYDDYYFCYLGWGTWDKCTPGTTPALQYYTSLYTEKDRPLCTSLCGKFGYDYNWCFTGEKGYWDYCSDRPGISSVNSATCVKPCHRYEKTYYYCVTGVIDQPASVIIDNPGLTWHKESWDYCAPDPVNITLIQDVSMAIVRFPGEFTKTGYRPLEHCIRTKRNNDTHRDVDQLAADYEAAYPPVQLSSPQVAVTSYTCMPAPPLGFQYQELLTLVVRATILPRHLNNTRDAIPSFITQRMINMNALPDDERGHLLAASLGGPTQQFNFAPQSTRVNRGYGGESYWYNIEGYIRDFLRNTPNGRVEWVLTVAYGDLTVSRRPIGFALRFRQFNGNVLVNDSGNCYFTNGSTDECEII